MTVRKLSAKELYDWQSQGQDFTLIDVLPEGTYEDEHIPGAINIPLGDSEFAPRVEEFTGQPDPKKTVVVYCANTECDLSPKAADKLDAMGFEQVFDFEGGLEEWKEKGYATSSGGADSEVSAG